MLTYNMTMTYAELLRIALIVSDGAHSYNIYSRDKKNKTTLLNYLSTIPRILTDEELMNQRNIPFVHTPDQYARDR